MTSLKLVLVTGAFNVLHPGHVRLLRFARECGDRLVVAVSSDRLAGSGAYVPQGLRLEGVRSNSWVDEAFINDETIANVISRLQPNIVVKGKEHEHRFNPEQLVLESYGGKLLVSSGESVFSSVDLLRKEILEFEAPQITLPEPYMERHNISSKRLASIVRSFGQLKLCVIGDLMVDEYITCEAQIGRAHV